MSLIRLGPLCLVSHDHSLALLSLRWYSILVRYDEHLWSFSPSTIAIPKPQWSFERRSGCTAHASSKGIRGKSERWAYHFCPQLILLITVIDYVQRYATKEAADASTEKEEDEDEEMSDMGSISDDDETTGAMDLWPSPILRNWLHCCSYASVTPRLFFFGHFLFY